MESINNIITLKNTCTSTVPLRREEQKEELGREELEGLVYSMQNVLDHMESIWENNHSTVELRDKFHLLHCYFGYINQYYERCLP
ncbi:MAG: hypothetical protein NT178_11515 [Proteobacteria bacterium]|nr:hypothetical protein [Pseudomonadota bacterium]